MKHDLIEDDREEVARKINRAMGRLPLILKHLEYLSGFLVPSPGDEEMRHGCERALTSILAALARIRPSIPACPASGPGCEERMARRWLEDPLSSRLIDPERFARLSWFIHMLLPPAALMRKPQEIPSGLMGWSADRPFRASRISSIG